MILLEDDNENFLCPKCMTILECHGCTGYNHINNVYIEQDASWYWCPKCKEVINDD